MNRTSKKKTSYWFLIGIAQNKKDSSERKREIENAQEWEKKEGVCVYEIS